MNRAELIAASDEVIEDAVQYADPMVLRGLLYQLTGDETLADMTVGMVDAGFFQIAMASDPADVEMVRAKAADFLKKYRDDGAGEIPIGPADRLRRSMELVAGVTIPDCELDLWLEELAIDPWARALEWTDKTPPPAAALSVGQQQRVAAARALVGHPEVVIADEPTSALDAPLRQAFMEVLLQQCSAFGTTLVFVSHDERLAARFDRVVALSAINHAGSAGSQPS